jgi:hypothetical protein
MQIAKCKMQNAKCKMKENTGENIMKYKTAWIFLAALFYLSCAGEEISGVAETPAADPDKIGPMVVFDPLLLPEPEIPYPNDFATRYDKYSPTGKRLNISITAPGTTVESKIRKWMDELDGFSLSAPVSVSFTGTLDLSTVNDSTVLIVNAETGEFIPVDLGKGNYPVNTRTDSYFPNDPMKNEGNYLLPKTNVIDMNNDGKEEFVDFYEVSTNTLLIKPVIAFKESSEYAVVLTGGIKGYFTDKQKNKTYGSIRSPFPYVNHPSQTPDLEKIIPYLEKKNIKREDIAFAWTFTTQSISPLFIKIRDGLYGKGEFSYLASEVSDKIAAIHNPGITFDGDGTKELFGYIKDDNMFILQGEYLEQLFKGVFAMFGDMIGAYGSMDFSHVDYVIFGEIQGADFRANGLKNDNVFSVDLHTGNALHEISKPLSTWEGDRDFLKHNPEIVPNIPFLITIPKTTDAAKPPFPVVFYSHGSNTSRFEMLMVGNTLAKFGLAGAAIDCVGHGPLAADLLNLLDQGCAELVKKECLPEDKEFLIKMLLSMLADYLFPGGTNDIEGKTTDEMINMFYANGIVKQLAVYGRTMDENGDGILQNGESFYVKNPVRQRDAFRQTVIDFMEFVRVIRALNQSKIPAKYQGDTNKATSEELMPYVLNGDFNADGILDLGGPEVPMYISGTSLGGMVASMVAAVEPEISATVPLVAGSGLIEAFTRTKLDNVITASFLFALGPVVVGCNQGEDIFLTFNNDSDGCKEKVLLDEKKKIWFAKVKIQEKTKVTLINLKSGETAETQIEEKSGGFSISVAADLNDPMKIIFNTGKPDQEIVEINAKYDGLGLKRNTPRFRKNMAFTQGLFDSSDSASFSQFYFRYPLFGKPQNILQIAVLKDATMPVSCQLSFARNLGTLGAMPDGTFSMEKNFEMNQFLVAQGVAWGSEYDIDDVDKNNGGAGPLIPVKTSTGVSAVRWTPAVKFDCKEHPETCDGWHEYMALPYPDTEPFDYATYTHNMLGLYLKSGGKKVVDDVCIAKKDCEDLKECIENKECKLLK